MHSVSGANRICRDQLQEYNRLNEEIADAMSNIAVGPQVDDTELDEELEALQQQDLDDKMLKTGTVPVDSIQQRLPTVANGERELTPWITCQSVIHWIVLMLLQSRARHLQLPLPRTTRKQNSGGCKPKWLCEHGIWHAGLSHLSRLPRTSTSRCRLDLCCPFDFIARPAWERRWIGV